MESTMAAGMTVLIRKNKCFTCLMAFLVLLGLSVTACAEPKRSKQMTEHEARLWTLVDGIHNHLPLNIALVEDLTRTALIEVSRNEYFALLEGAPNLMAVHPGQGFISKTEFSYRLSNPADHSFSIHIDSTVPCISSESVRARYKDMELLSPPSPPPQTPGQPLIDSPVYRTKGWAAAQQWGRLAFIFHPVDSSRGECLAKVGFRFNKP
jgi:hypothetical protein